MYNVIILFGVSGCGKSLIGNQLSKDLQFEFIEGDDFHSNENIEKMKNNIPLNDDDREVWLDQINKELNKLRNKNVFFIFLIFSLEWKSSASINLNCKYFDN